MLIFQNWRLISYIWRIKKSKWYSQCLRKDCKYGHSFFTLFSAETFLFLFAFRRSFICLQKIFSFRVYLSPKILFVFISALFAFFVYIICFDFKKEKNKFCYYFFPSEIKYHFGCITRHPMHHWQNCNLKKGCLEIWHRHRVN